MSNRTASRGSLPGHIAAIAAPLVALLLLAGCGRAAAAVATPTALPRAMATPVPPTPTSAPAPTATPEAPGAALAALGTQIDALTADADRQNSALEDKLNAGTTLSPLSAALQAAVTANQQAAAAVNDLALPPGIASYRAVQRYQAAIAAAYGAQADAWAALLRAAKTGAGDAQDNYQSLSAQATAQFHAASVAHDRALIAFGDAAEGSAPD